MNVSEFSALPDVGRMSATAAAYEVLEALAAGSPEGVSSFGGKLLLCADLGEAGFAYSLAMSIAGGTFLGVESRPQRLKEALRDGVCDYMVNSLDEALRVLKNEIRKKTPISVGLLGDLTSIVKEAVDRGVQPEFVVAGTSLPDAAVLDVFLERGAINLITAAAQVERVQPADLVVACAASTSILRNFERAVTTVLDGSTASRLKWAESSPRYFRRTTPPMRSALLNESQTAALEGELARQPLDGDLMLAVQSATDGQWRVKEFGSTVYGS
jgi:urocanate hydratase